MLDKIKRNIFVVLGFATLIYFSLIIYSDFDLILKSFQNFPLPTFLQILFLIILTIALKFKRWDIYLKKIDVLIDVKNSVLIFLSGFIMSISPGKVGELLKAYLIKEKYNISKSKTFPIILAERISEFIALIIVSVIGIILYNFEAKSLIIPILLLTIILALGLNSSIKNKLFQTFSKSTLLKNRMGKLEVFHSSINLLFQPIIFIKILIISLAAWIIEFYCFYLIIDALSKNINLIFASSVYSISIIIGAVSMLPGGIGTTEASLVYQLVNNGITEADAITSTFIIRISTLWFPVLVGFIAYVKFLKKNKKNDKIL